ncbi:MAG TPA: hypothetical protein PL187_13600 [Caldilinea sp.]|nr:hypothetical protein [Caldilinea sp.]
MATIIDRISTLWQRRATPAVVTAPPTEVRTVRPAAVDWTAQADRRAQIADSRQMALEDPRPKQSMATLARDATKGGFTLQITGPRAAQAQAAADALLARLRVFQRLDDWARLTFRDGDTFLELGVAANGEIVQVTRKPTAEMYRNSDDFDRFADPARAFYWTERPTYSDTPPADAVFFPEWQIVHARWDGNEGSRYGAPMFASARRAYKRMSQGELDIAVRRKTRSGLRYAHILDGANQAEMEAYKAANAPALDDPYAAVADFFFNRAGGLQVVQGDAQLAQIDDVLHHVDTFGLASITPLELMGYGRNLNRDVLEQKKAQYDEALGSVRGWLGNEFVLPMLERQWLLLGIWPDDLEVDLQWKTKKESTPTDLREMAGFAAAVKASGLLTDATILRILATKLPDFDVDAEIAALAVLAAEREAQAQEMERVAANAGAGGEDDDAPEDGEGGE